MIQLNIDMPENCSDCPCNNDHYICGATGNAFDHTKAYERRMDDCPLIDVKSCEDAVSRADVRKMVDKYLDRDDCNGSDVAMDIITDLSELPSVQPEESDTSEFWRKRADYYSDMCMNLIGEMGKGVKIESVKISENGIEFIKEQPSEQPIDLQELEDRFGEYVRFVVNDMLTGEGKRWTR